MKPKILYAIALQNFRDEELTVPKAILEAAGYRVDIAANERKQCFGAVKTKVFPDLTLREARMSDFAGIVIAGGGGAVPYLWNNAALLKLVQEAHAAGKPVAAICLAAAVPAQAGILKGKRGTVWPEPKAIDELNKGGVDYVAGQVVVSDGVVTAPGPDKAKEFGEAVLALLQS